MIERISPGPRMSTAVVHAGVVYTSGQVDPDGADVTEQTKTILGKIDALLAQAGTDKSRALSASIWLADISTFHEMNAVWETWIVPGSPPARATVESRLANPNYKVEISIIAATGD